MSPSLSHGGSYTIKHKPPTIGWQKASSHYDLSWIIIPLQWSVCGPRTLNWTGHTKWYTSLFLYTRGKNILFKTMLHTHRKNTSLYIHNMSRNFTQFQFYILPYTNNSQNLHTCQQNHLRVIPFDDVFFLESFLPICPSGSFVLWRE